ncbi:MAG TPA: sulfatase-like hydrolase/transferase [Candidatus Solibacter sp.]|nr:sulfatase-like hydrolase/transferase [Candidatus Solibacter sp.]
MFRRPGKWIVLGILIIAQMRVECHAAAKPSIILITADSVRADRMGFLGGKGALTPNLDAMARQSVVFAQAYAQSPGTVSSHATILSGTYPQTHRASEFSVPLSAALPYLPDLLHSAGYKTAAFVGSILLDPKDGPFQKYDRGFGVYDANFHPPQRGESHDQSVDRRASDVIARATKWLAENKQRPVFLWVQIHDPEQASSATYDRAIAAADAAIGKLLDSLRKQSFYEDAAIVVTSAHGESLGAHGEETHGLFLHDETIHVPLLLKLPKAQMAGRRVKNRVRLLDIAPTLLEAAGLSVPSQMQGQSLLRLAQSASQSEQPAYARADLPEHGFQCSAIESWRSGKWLYIRAPKPELYDLSADPGASHNLAATSKATLDTLASLLQAFDSRLANEHNSSASSLTSSEMQKLASLGYVGLQKSDAGVKAAAEGPDITDSIFLANKTLAAMRDLDDGKPEKAIPALKSVIDVQPNIYMAQFGLASALFQQQKFADAIPYLHKAIELQPGSAWAHYLMGVSLVKTGDFKTSEVHLQVASQRLPSFTPVHSALAEVYEHLGRTQEAARERASISGGDHKKND